MFMKINSLDPINKLQNTILAKYSLFGVKNCRFKMQETHETRFHRRDDVHA